MDKVVKIVFVLFLFFLMDVDAQTVTWQKYFDINNRDNSGIDILQTYDKGYIVLSNNFFTPTRKMSIQKLNAFGNLEWQKIYEDSLINLIPTCIQQTQDNNFVISGYGSSRMFILKINHLGIPIWIKYYSKQGADVRGYLHKITNDNKIIACGSVFRNSPLSENSYIIKTDSSGNKEWDNEFSDSLYSSASNIIQTNSDRFYLTGSTVTNTFSGDYYCIVKSIDSKGKLIWNRIFGKKKHGGNIILNSDDKLYIGGYFDSSGARMHLCKLDTNGQIIFLKSYNQNTGIAMCKSVSGKIILSGASFYRIDSTYSTEVVGFAKIDTSGNIISTNQIFTKIANYYSFARRVNQTDDNGFIFVGQTDFPNANDDNILVIKSDSLGNAPKIVGIQINNSEIPEKFFLNQNYPNPFNSSTIISYKLNLSGNIKIRIVDILGKMVLETVKGNQEAGEYSYELNFNELSSGIYFCILIKDELILDKKKMFLVK